jgi:hypothetical protein
MSDQLREQLKRRLDDLDLLVLMVDGIEVARRTVVVALGILPDGRSYSITITGNDGRWELEG